MATFELRSSDRFPVGTSVGAYASSAFGPEHTGAPPVAATEFAGPGSRLTDVTGAKLYINANTKASPTWVVAGTQS